MSNRIPSSVFRTLLMSVVGLVAANTTHAAETTLRFQGQLVNSSANAIALSGEFGSGPGAYLGVEFHLNERFGIEVGASWFELDESETLDGIFLSTDLEASLAVTPITVALNVHLTPQKRYDVYLAPKIGWAFFDDLELTTRIDFGGISFPGFPGLPDISFPGFDNSIATDFTTDDQFVFGLRLGFDVPFGDSSWSFSSSIDYTDMDIEAEVLGIPVPGVGLDPLAIGAGVAYSF